MAYQEKLDIMVQNFGSPITEVTHHGRKSAVFWAPESCWNNARFQLLGDIFFTYDGPHKQGSLPFSTPECDGYCVFLPVE